MTPEETITREEFYALAELGVWAGIAIACLLALVLGMAFVRQVLS